MSLQRGMKSMFQAMKFGSSSIKAGLRDQMAELKSDSRKQDGMADGGTGKKAYPGELKMIVIHSYPALIVLLPQC